MLEFKASLITVKLEKEMQIVSLKIIKNIQPISVGVWGEKPSSSELESYDSTNAHEVKKMWNSEMKFTLIPIYELLERAKKFKIEL